MAYLGRMWRRVRRSLVARLLLAAAPVALVVALLVGWVATPLLHTPGDVSRAERDLVEVQRYQSLLSLLDEQALHWSEYQYLPEGELAGIRAEMRGVIQRLDELRRGWRTAPLAARSALATYDALEVRAQRSISEVDAGEQPAALRLLTSGVLPQSRALREELQSELLKLASPLDETFSELSGSVQASLLWRTARRQAARRAPRDRPGPQHRQHRRPGAAPGQRLRRDHRHRRSCEPPRQRTSRAR